MCKELLLITLLGVVVSGCTKETPPAPPPPPVAATPKAMSVGGGEEAPPPPGGSTVASEPVVPLGPKIKGDEPEDKNDPDYNTALIGLQTAVEQYIQDQKRKPASFQEMVQAGYLEKAPVAPAGKKFIIDQTTYQVKEVKQ